jgi:ribosome-binding factor A
MTYSRIDRVAALLKQEIAQIVDRDLKNPKLPNFITIFGVKVSKDLHYATVVVTFLDDTSPEQIKEVIDELNKSVGFISRLVAQRVKLRRHPHLRFVYNPSTRYALDMEKLFIQIRNEPPIVFDNEETAGGEWDGDAPGEDDFDDDGDGVFDDDPPGDDDKD